MNTSIYNLQYDFEQQHGHFMIITGGETDGLHSEDLANVQVNMMKSNSIDKVLPIEIEEIDFNVKLYYNITSKRILSHVLREKKLTINEFYKLLYEIVSGIEASKEYMLNEHHYIIHEDFIYIGKDFSDIYLTYLPLNQVENKPDLKDEVRELLIKLVGHVQELTGDGVQQLMNYLQDPTFNLDELKDKLNSLIERPKQDMEKYVPVAQKVEQKTSLPVQEKPKPKPVPKPVPKKAPIKNKPKQQKVKKEFNQNSDAETVEEEPEKPNTVVVFAAAFLGIAGVWKLYDSMPSDGMLYICIGLSLLVVTAAYYFLQVHNQVKFSEKSIPEKTEKPNSKRAKRRSVKQGVTPNPVDEEDPSEQQVAATMNKEQYYQNLQNQTTLLSQPNATVLLNEENEGLNTPYLHVTRDGRPEKIHVTENSFTIGRNPSGVEYVEDSVGISRIHLEILQEDERFMVKDLGSKNGSKLNQQSMVAYKVYDLHDGDSISIGKVEYTFKTG